MEKTEQKEIISPKILSGFKDRLPAEALAKSRLISRLVSVFESFGFAPIETPHLEYLQMLTKQGSDEIEKEMYAFKDHGGRDVCLRFDLTVPLARFSALHLNEIQLPFKRYCVGNVFRGERAQKGRYREFTQCDFDFIGTNSINADAEILCVIASALRALGVFDFTISVNCRKIFNGLCEALGQKERVVEILRIIDKIDKIGENAVLGELCELGIQKEKCEIILEFLAQKQEPNELNTDFLARILDYCEKNSLKNEILESGLNELKELNELLSNILEPKFWRINLSIARGLGYYTGLVYETTLNALPNLGSVASGGRYDDLCSQFSKTKLSGVGASVGLDRLLFGLLELNLLQMPQSPAQILLIGLDKDSLKYAYETAVKLRADGLCVEVLPELVKAKKAFSYADNKGFLWVGVCGESEKNANEISLKNMKTSEQKQMPLSAVKATIFGK